jgi:hypothetical protein
MKYVYVMRPKPFLKIGVSKSPQARRMQPAHAEVLYAIESPVAERIEAVVHEALKNVRQDGEWFDADLEKAIQTIESAVRWLDPEANRFRSFLDVLFRLQGEQSRKDFAEELGTTYWRVIGWYKHDTIPSKHWDAILDLAARQGRKEITWELLNKLRSEKKRKKPAKSG